MKKLLLSAAIATSILLTGCASVDFMQYSDQEKVVVGSGGTFRTYDDMEIWQSGAPKKPFHILGVINASITDGIGADTMMNSAVVSEARKQGADAIIVVSAHTQSGAPVTINQQDPYAEAENNDQWGYLNGYHSYNPYPNSGQAFMQGATAGANMASTWIAMANSRSTKHMRYIVIRYTN